MIDLWTASFLTFIVTLVSVITDSLASQYFAKSRFRKKISIIIASNDSASAMLDSIRDLNNEFNVDYSKMVTPGADLAAVAISLDFTALGIWIHDQSMFPFFARFNDDMSSREIPVWLIIIGVHFVLLLGSMCFKHYSGEVSGANQDISIGWFTKNKWALLSNGLGFFALLSSITILTNAV